MASDLFYLIDFTISMLISVYNWILSVVTIIIIFKQRELRTFNYLLLCNSCVGIVLNSMLALLTSILGLNQSWAENVLNCQIHGYFYDSSLTFGCFFPFQCI